MRTLLSLLYLWVCGGDMTSPRVTVGTAAALTHSAHTSHQVTCSQSGLVTTENHFAPWGWLRKYEKGRVWCLSAWRVYPAFVIWWLTFYEQYFAFCLLACWTAVTLGQMSNVGRMCRTQDPSLKDFILCVCLFKSSSPLSLFLLLYSRVTKFWFGVKTTDAARR